jgi:hypothetical protein
VLLYHVLGTQYRETVQSVDARYSYTLPFGLCAVVIFVPSVVLCCVFCKHSGKMYNASSV